MGCAPGRTDPDRTAREGTRAADRTRFRAPAHRTQPAAQQPVCDLRPRRGDNPLRRTDAVAHEDLLHVRTGFGTGHLRGRRRPVRLRARYGGALPGTLRRVRGARRRLRAVLDDRRGNGGREGLATEMRAHAATNRYWGAFAAPARLYGDAPAGIISPHGEWAARCPGDGTPSPPLPTRARRIRQAPWPGPGGAERAQAATTNTWSRTPAATTAPSSGSVCLDPAWFRLSMPEPGRVRLRPGRPDPW